MSRIAKSPVEIPAGVEVKLEGQDIIVKGSKGSMTLAINNNVEVKEKDSVLSFAPRNKTKSSMALAGTTRSLVNNMVVGVTTGFERKLVLNGVGYRTKVSGKTLNLILGFSHDVNYELPEGVTAETPSQTEIMLRSADKQLLGQVASDIRAFRPPEPYKGKGIRYADEHVRRKEAKKK